MRKCRYSEKRASEIKERRIREGNKIFLIENKIKKYFDINVYIIKNYHMIERII